MVAPYLKGLEKIVKETMREVYQEYSQEVDRVIRSDTEFADQGFVGQDIVLSGALLNSKQEQIQENAGRFISQVSFSWNPVNPDNGAAYAVPVWRGFFAYGGTKFIPGRQWDTRAIKNYRPTSQLVKKLRSRGLKAQIIVDNENSLP